MNKASITISLENALLSQNISNVDCLQKVNEHLNRILVQVNSNSGHELIAMDIRQALHYLGEITGEISTDDQRESIFTRFCMGKWLIIK